MGTIARAMYVVMTAGCVWASGAHAISAPPATDVGRAHVTGKSAACPVGVAWSITDEKARSNSESTTKTNAARRSTSTRAPRVATEKTLAAKSKRTQTSPSESTVANKTALSSGSRTKLQLSCRQRCQSERDACSVSGGKKGTHSCAAIYNECVQAC